MVADQAFDWLTPMPLADLSVHEDTETAEVTLSA